MNSNMKNHCPTCHAIVNKKDNGATFPFCSERCKLIDLGKWLNEEYRIPVKNDEIEDSVPTAVEACAEEKDLS